MRVSIDFRKVAAQRRLAAGERQAERAELGELVEDLENLRGRHLAALALAVGRGLVDVAVNAGEVAAVRELNRAAERNAIAADFSDELERARSVLAPRRRKQDLRVDAQ